MANISDGEYELVRRASYGLLVHNWYDVASIVTQIDAAQAEAAGAPPVDLEQRTACNEAVIRKLADHAGELAVNYTVIQSEGSPQIHRFSSIVLDPYQPMTVDISSTRASEDTVKSDRYHLALNYMSKKASGSYPLVGAREIVISEGSNPVWMGAGVNPDDVRLSNCYLEKTESRSELAIGTKEVATLFSKLAEKPELDKRHLFGGLFHVALLADDFEAEIPEVTALDEEAAQAQSALNARHLLSSRLISINQPMIQTFQGAVGRFDTARKSLARDLSRKDGEQTAVHLPYMGDQRTWPFIDVDSFGPEVNTMNHVVHALEQEVKEHRRRIENYSSWYRIISQIRGDAV